VVESANSPPISRTPAHANRDRRVVGPNPATAARPTTPLPLPRRKPLDDRQVLNGILFVLVTGIGWEHLPRELGYGSGMTCWRRLRDWNAAGVWDRLHQILLGELREADQLDWSRALVDSSHVRAIGGATRLDRARSIAAGSAPSIT
jgi:transposase